MVINGTHLLAISPIVDMLAEKVSAHGVSHGLGEAGYDIRIAQDVVFNGVSGNTRRTHNKDETRTEINFSGRFVIASAIEEFSMPSNLMGIVHDKSTWARKGLSMFNTVIEPGWKGFLTLELVYHGDEKLVIPAGAGIAQVVFHHVSEPRAYTGKYQNQEDKPVAARESKPIVRLSKFTGTKCIHCLLPQFMTPSGITCENGHGGADSV